MVDFHKLKNLGTDIMGRAGEIAEHAKDRVAPLAEQAKDRVAPLAEQAKDRVVPLAGKAKDAATKGVDKAAGGLDSATGHKYHHKLGAVTGNRDKNPTTNPAADVNDPEPTEQTADVAEPKVAAPAPTESDTAARDAAELETVELDEPAPENAAIYGSNPLDAPATEVIDAELTEVPSETAQTTHSDHPTPADMPQHRATEGDTL